MKKGLKTLLAGIAIFIIGAIVVPILILIPLFKGGSEDEQFIIPGEHRVTVPEEGRYYLWNNYRTIFEGQSYHRSEEIPDGLDFSITTSTGEALPFFSDTSTSSSNGSSSKNSIGYVKVAGPETLSISVSGDSEKRIFSFSKSILGKMFGLIFLGGALSVLSAFAGIGIIIWGIIKMVQGSKTPPPPMPSA